MALKFRILTIGLLFIAAGCQSSSTSMVRRLPEPNFNPPPVAMASIIPSSPTQIRSTPQARPTVAYASAAERAWIPPVPARPWKWIVIHHSATPSGSAAEFDKMHREKGWDELGYHFVIGNGTGSGNGQIEIGPRWPKQKWGAHAKTPDNRFNDFGIGICLVGNFDIERPTQQQMDSLVKIVSYMMRTYHIPASNVLGHRDTKPTDCPGRNLNIAQVRAMAMQSLADSGVSVDATELAVDPTLVPAGTELMGSINP